MGRDLFSILLVFRQFPQHHLQANLHIDGVGPDRVQGGGTPPRTDQTTQAVEKIPHRMGDTEERIHVGEDGVGVGGVRAMVLLGRDAKVIRRIDGVVRLIQHGHNMDVAQPADEKEERFIGRQTRRKPFLRNIRRMLQVGSKLENVSLGNVGRTQGDQDGQSREPMRRASGYGLQLLGHRLADVGHRLLLHHHGDRGHDGGIHMRRGFRDPVDANGVG
ncbi:uncharacterized protein BO66DRAFT_233518 [Aspergillus aculeatinus CBS 121060]|uniref:Uncharacterized protein n=1 Tax=Aspergillus aculeatinus CBS 121060 TaxID=1448322 RepID=A0ACD1GTB5_9EURO|nr:hypothetical protein BO66DRAFT_233518 [Aspergillus aculeatinus CBS 121060]RAH64596.1 hypothetical protein BO66DRAFT_233518 [Aspergillus aculeatinus CBS 121060]